jgi:hypothetical protein
MGYKLKLQYESFTVVDGPFAGKTFDHATEYEAIPPGEAKKFERIDKIEKGSPTPAKKPSRGASVREESPLERTDAE